MPSQFGKDLEQYKHTGWEDEYIDYKALKLILSRILEPGAIKDEVDGDFFQALEDEMEKVNRAFHEHASEIEAALDGVTDQKKRPSTAPGVGMSGLSIEGSGEPSSQTSAAEAAAARESRNEDARQSEKIFYDAYRTLGRLQTFVWINAKGFQKIMKKYDKRNSLRGTGLELLPEFEKRLEKEAFCSGKVSAAGTAKAAEAAQAAQRQRMPRKGSAGSAEAAQEAQAARAARFLRSPSPPARVTVASFTQPVLFSPLLTRPLCHPPSGGDAE